MTPSPGRGKSGSPDPRQRENGRGWINVVAQTCERHEIEECMGDLLDRAEFAEEMARRHIVERLAAAMRSWEADMGWSGTRYAEVQAVLAELEALRRV